jgi:uncharacterized protein with PIN domain
MAAKRVKWLRMIGFDILLFDHSDDKNYWQGTHWQAMLKQLAAPANS